MLRQEETWPYPNQFHPSTPELGKTSLKAGYLSPLFSLTLKCMKALQTYQPNQQSLKQTKPHYQCKEQSNEWAH